jgi:hypothetical protein
MPMRRMRLPLFAAILLTVFNLAAAETLHGEGSAAEPRVAAFDSSALHSSALDSTAVETTTGDQALDGAHAACDCAACQKKAAKQKADLKKAVAGARRRL